MLALHLYRVHGKPHVVTSLKNKKKKVTAQSDRVSKFVVLVYKKKSLYSIVKIRKNELAALTLRKTEKFNFY